MPVTDQTPDVILYDSNGVEIAVANGVAIPTGTRGLLSTGSDGTNARFVAVDTSGRQIAVGAAAAGAAPVGNPVLVGGSDGVNVRTPLLDASGRAQTNIAQWFGATTPTVGQKAMAASIPIVIASDQTPIPVTGGASGGGEQATWSVFAPAVAVNANKSMISLLNATGTAVVIRLREIWVENVQATAVTGVLGFFEVHRMTGHSAGTLLTPLPYDTTDVLDSNVTARTDATIAGEAAGILVRHRWSTDEWTSGALDGEQYEHGIQASQPFWSRKDMSEKPITLRSGEGITVKFATSSTVGTFDLTLVFTQASS